MAEFWRYGGTPNPVVDVAGWAKQFESWGWDGLAVGEDPGWAPDPYVYLSAAAAATSTLKLGSAVLAPIREPLVMANAMATLDALSHGRMTFGVGRGDGAVTTLGLRPLNLSAFELFLVQLRSYMKGEDVLLNGSVTNLKQLRATDLSYEEVRPVVDIAATGPRMIALASRLAESVTFAVGGDLARLEKCVSVAHAECKAAGRDLDTLGLGCYVSSAVVVNGDRAAARGLVSGAVLRHARLSAFDGKVLDGVSKQDETQIIHAFDVTRDREREMPKKADWSSSAFVTDEFIDRAAIIGEPAECAERFSRIIDLGIDRIVVCSRVPNTDPSEENAARLSQEVFPLLR